MLNVARLIKITDKVTSLFSFVGYFEFLLEVTPTVVKQLLTEISELRKELRKKQRYFKTKMGFEMSKEELKKLIENINNVYNELDKIPNEELSDIKFELDTEKVQVKLFYSVIEQSEMLEKL